MANRSLCLTAYPIIVPLSFLSILIAACMASLILFLVVRIRRLHTVTHLLICNASMASIFYCLVQSVNYVFLLFIPSQTTDISCRCRAFFAYMAIAAVMYSYLAQAISRFLVSSLSSQHRWAMAFRTHIMIIVVQWIVVLLVPLPALIAEDIHYRPFALCWVSRQSTLHLTYTVLVYYAIPALSIFTLYGYIYVRVKRGRASVFITIRQHRSHRDLELLCNIMILFIIYVVGALPTIVFIITGFELLYAVGIIFVSSMVAVEKLAAILIDRDMRTIVKNFLRRPTAQIRPIV